jgi:hypothetical protein
VPAAHTDPLGPADAPYLLACLATVHATRGEPPAATLVAILAMAAAAVWPAPGAARGTPTVTGTA